MDAVKLRDIISKVNCSLELKRKVVGVKFLFTEEEFEEANAKKLRAKSPYCVMVKTAMSGYSIKATLENFGCLASARNLGILEADEIITSGRYHSKSGLYQDLTTSKNTISNMTMCKHKAYGVMIKPLEEYTENPDVVLIITSSYNAMRIIQGYTYMYGAYSSFKMLGNNAVCSECTAYPYESNNINVSLLCSGTRHMCGWGDDEIGIGMPFNRFSTVVDGIYATINPIEPNKNKSIIESKLKEEGRDDLDIVYDKNYYTGLYLK
ncbi:DUF169 domain-containing protein [Proteiniborus sp. MB09-C3]|uniref:DUF169 domain-containing protein n=1 Tax=Proteiniborus sp. MB09-C3 TaxID=3050072 RepID=UPI0025534584|nr:DUF169 domain-containing protein [Proteiniborus sp. MB09-C3]WIV12170.1 DUF169 domain-containing protein [Proteiniborus sp. MB09-C3]